MAEPGTRSHIGVAQPLLGDDPRHCGRNRRLVTVRDTLRFEAMGGRLLGGDDIDRGNAGIAAQAGGERVGGAALIDVALGPEE